jgi:hypothetical protein
MNLISITNEYSNQFNQIELALGKRLEVGGEENLFWPPANIVGIPFTILGTVLLPPCPLLFH